MERAAELRAATRLQTADAIHLAAALPRAQALQQQRQP
jgi:hypothetical protein